MYYETVVGVVDYLDFDLGFGAQVFNLWIANGWIEAWLGTHGRRPSLEVIAFVAFSSVALPSARQYLLDLTTSQWGRSLNCMRARSRPVDKAWRMLGGGF